MDNSIEPRPKGRAPPPPDLAPGLLLLLRNQLCVFDEGAGARGRRSFVSGPRFFDGLVDLASNNFRTFLLIFIIWSVAFNNASSTNCAVDVN